MAEEITIIFKDDKGRKVRIEKSKIDFQWTLWENSIGKGANTLFDILENMKKDYPDYKLLEIQSKVTNVITT